MNQQLIDLLEETFRYGVATNADDIRGNDKAYLNLQKHAVKQAEAKLNKYISEIIGKDYTDVEMQLATQPAAAKMYAINVRLAEQRKAAGITVDGEKA